MCRSVVVSMKVFDFPKSSYFAKSSVLIRCDLEYFVSCRRCFKILEDLLRLTLK